MTKLFKKPVSVPEYSLCERVTATDTSPRHIRKVNSGILFRGGGADTPALCGGQVSWDTRALDLADIPNIIANETKTYRLCRSCVTAATTPSLVG